MAWSFNEHTPVYIQIADKLRNDIISGIFPAGEQIPTVRQLAMTAAVNPNTVQRALTELESEGIIHAKGTNGRFVTEDEQILLSAREASARRLVKDFIAQAQCMSISKSELIKMIEEDNEYEHS